MVSLANPFKYLRKKYTNIRQTQEVEEEKHYQLIYEGNKTLNIKRDKIIAKKGSFTSIMVMYRNTKIFNQILTKQIQKSKIKH